MNAPIIFIHYNDSKYMKYTLQSAVVNNPDKNVYLIGDSTNKHYEKFGVIHHFFSDYLFGKDLEEFESVFQFIVGVQFNNSTYGEQWTRFNFRKWFVLSNFLKKNNINTFWTFDSDVLIIERLNPFENQFKNYDYTTCSGDLHQLFGYVRNSDLIKKFSKSVVDMFTDDNYLNEQRRIMQENPGWGLTMMRAFQRFRNRKGIKTLDIFNIPGIIPEILFLDYNRGLPSEISRNSDGFVNIYFNKEGAFAGVSNGFYRIPLMNMSWMPDYLMSRLFRLTSIKHNVHSMVPMSFKMPISEKAKSRVLRLISLFPKC